MFKKKRQVGSLINLFFSFNNLALIIDINLYTYLILRAEFNFHRS